MSLAERGLDVAAGGSGGAMKKNCSLLFNIEDVEDDCSPGAADVYASTQTLETSLECDLRALAERSTGSSEQVWRAVQALAVDHNAPIKDIVKAVARALRAQLGYEYRIVIRKANPKRTGQGAGECLRNLHHEFVVVTAGEEDYVVDACFKEQFELAQQTPAFVKLLDVLPAVVVLPTDRVLPVVELLCRAMSNCFKAANIEMPPWRRADALISKWRPRRSLDCPLLPPGDEASVLRSSTPLSSPRLSAERGLAGGAALPSSRGWDIAGAFSEAQRSLGLRHSCTRPIAPQHAAGMRAEVAAVAKGVGGTVRGHPSRLSAQAVKAVQSALTLQVSATEMGSAARLEEAASAVKSPGVLTPPVKEQNAAKLRRLPSVDDVRKTLCRHLPSLLT